MKHKKLWINLVNIILISVLSFYVIIFGIKKALNHEIYAEPNIKIKVYTIWHVETFEGGGKPRISYLKNIAKEIETEDPSVLFMISEIKAENLKNELECSVPDIISFGYGVGKTILPYLVNQSSTQNVRDELIESGTFNNKLYAIPFMTSGYVKISHPASEEIYFCGQNSYINPSKLSSNLNIDFQFKDNQYEAYKNFVNNKHSHLIGTARDVFRVENLNKTGRTNATFEAISDFTDLIQYLGITKKDNTTQKFLSLSLSESKQQSLIDYSIFGTKNIKLYSFGIYNDMENAIMNATIPNVFYDQN